MDPSGTVWSIISVWDPPLKQLPSQQQIHWHYVGLRMGPIWKVFLGSFLSIVTAADLLGIIWGYQDNYPPDNYPPDNYPRTNTPRTITPLGQIPPGHLPPPWEIFQALTLVFFVLIFFIFFSSWKNQISIIRHGTLEHVQPNHRWPAKN